MNRSLLVLAVIFGCCACAVAAHAQEPTSLTAVKALSNAEAALHPSVSFEATVTYFRSYEDLLFVQDGDTAIFVSTPDHLTLVPGDRVRITGTMRPSFRPFVRSNEVRLVGHGPLPKPMHASVEDLLRAKADCKLVTVHAAIRSADLQMNRTFLMTTTSLHLLVDGEPMEATLNNNDPNALRGLLDAEAEITGVVSGKFDNKMQQTGVVFLIQSLGDIKILKHATADPWSLAVTPMDQILAGHREIDLSQRMRVHGTVTYYEPAEALVLQDGSKSVWITTTEGGAVHVGDLADAIGFPDVQNGFLTLRNSEIRDSAIPDPIVPRPFIWRDLAVGGNDGLSHLFELVSIEGQVVAEVQHATQDEYVLNADGHLFSAILRHFGSASHLPLHPMRQVPVGSRVRVSGVCMLADANPFNGDVPFNILMRSDGDIAVVAQPPWLSVRHLTVLVGLLILAIFAVGGWAWYIERKMRRQTSGLAYVEQRRGQILEAINASRPLAETLEQITELVSFKLKGAPSWCEISDGPTLGNCPPATSSTRSVIEQPIATSTGQQLGKFFAAIYLPAGYRIEAQKTLSMAAALARLAIETSRLHTDLVHRSEFDLLTDIQNRFSLEKNLEDLIQAARQSARIFGLIYIDLNEFKQVNDQHGHQTGDVYLQQVAQRIKKQLRPGDTFARLGGDEFAVLVPEVRNCVMLEEIALRLERCFDKPFNLDAAIVYHGSASFGIALYPEDATTKDGLFTAADAAMYCAKKTRKRFNQILASELGAETAHETGK